MGRQLEKFLLLTWKNWLLQWRHPVQTLIEILAPVLFSGLLVVIRSLVDPEEHESIEFPDFNPLEANISAFTQVAYSPFNPNLQVIMNDAAAQLGNLTVLSFNDSTALINFLQDEISIITTLAGVQFDNSLLGDQLVPKHVRATLSYNKDMTGFEKTKITDHICIISSTSHDRLRHLFTKRFPGELRGGTSFAYLLQNSWLTNLIFPVYQVAGPRRPFEEYTATPQYYEEGFLALQLAVTNGIIRFFGGTTADVVMQRYPYPGWIADPLLQALESFVGIIIMLSFVYSCISTVKIITTEKEKQLKEAMKIMGLPNWLHWTAWFLKCFFFLLISIVLIVVLLKVSWYPGTYFSVFTLANPFVLLLFLIFYISATITFCFMISVFFSRANTAAAIAGLAWFVSYAPYLFLQEQYSSLNLGVKLGTSLFSNTAMAWGFQLILMYEGTGDGLQWHNIFKPVTTDDSFTIGYVMLLLIFDTIIYLLVALYVEAIFPGEFGVPQKWYFPFTSSFWCGQPRYSGVENNGPSEAENSEYFQKDPENLPTGVQIKHLQKNFGNKAAVRDLSLNMYENQITVLLGHNGAGKTTTMSMLTGMFPPSGGTAIVGGFSIRTDMVKVRESLGLCPQHNILFDELTVEEHLYFYSKLKGLEGNRVKSEIDKYIDLLELPDKRNARSATLSGGMKRKLCVGVALCGDSKVVMLDEPTAGMDPSARRALWDLLQRQKLGRTVLLTTHFMDEADLLGDRIAIMAGGSLQCCGSSFFLKKKYGAGYHLIMEKTRHCDPSRVTDLLQKYIPDLQIESNVGSELTYCLNEDQSEVFESMLKDLESSSANLGVRSYGISLTTLEEVFMKVGADHGQEEELNASNGKSINHEVNGDDVHHRNLERNLSEAKLPIGDTMLTGLALAKNQFIAMLLKKILSILRTWNMLFIQIFLPVAFLIIAIIVTRNMGTDHDSPELEITLDSYDHPITVINGSNPYKNSLIKILQESGHLYTDLNSADLSNYIIQQTEEDVAIVRNRYIIGTSFKTDNVVHAWFNNQPYHSPPLALAVAMSAVLDHNFGSNVTVDLTNYPVPFTISTRLTQISQGNSMGFNLAFNMGFSMAFVSSFYVLFYIRERVVKAKHLQFVSGVNLYTFWLTSFLCDLVTFVLTALCLMVTLVSFQEEGFNTFEEIGRVFALLLCFGYSMLPLQYLVSFLFEVPSTGFVRMTLVSIFTGVAAFLTVQVLATVDLNLQDIADLLDWIFLVLPHYCLSVGINNVYSTFATYNLCNDLVDLCVETSQNIFPLTPAQCWGYVCQAQVLCCDAKTDYFKWGSPGVGRNIVFSVTVGTTLLILLLIIELGAFKKLIYYITQNSIPPKVEYIAEDSDVLEEKVKIKNASKAELEKYTLVMKDVTKYYKKLLAVHDISLGVERYECFGLLGVNGAGKTSTFKMMTGDIPISYGEAWVNGLSLKQDIKEVHKLIGYCPQFDALLDDLTGNETMIMFSLLRGIPFAESKFVAENLAREFDFYRHLHKKVKEYSGGNKRKLSTAIALIGDPPVLYLDEPTTGMDPATKRHLWNALCKVRDNGKCIVLTSHSMEECEALCTRLAIMVNGTFRCLGSTQHLKNKFSEGYTLTVKVQKNNENGEIFDSSSIENFIGETFRGAKLREKHQELMTYHIADKTISWSSMFGIMERAKKTLPIEDYSIGQSSLEQVFLMFTKYQRET